MTARQHRFVDEYLLDLNGTQAAVRAGYSRRTANQIASENLSKPDQRAIRVAQDIRASRVEISQDRVLRELGAIALFDLRDLFDSEGKLLPLSQVPSHARAALQVSFDADGAVFRIRSADKLRALEFARLE